MRGKIYQLGMLVSGAFAAIGAFTGFGQWAGWLAQTTYQPVTQVGLAGHTTYNYDATGALTGTLTGSMSVFGSPVSLGPSGWVIVVGWVATICLVITTCLWLVYRRSAEDSRLERDRIAWQRSPIEPVPPGTKVTTYKYDNRGELIGEPVDTEVPVEPVAR